MDGASDDDGDDETLCNVGETSPASDADETPAGASETPDGASETPAGVSETPEAGADETLVGAGETPESADETSPDGDVAETPAGANGGGGGRLAAASARVLSALDSEIEAVRVVEERAEEEEEKPWVCVSVCECVREFASMVAPPQLPEPGATISLLAAWAAVPAAAPRLPDAEHAEPGQHTRDAIDTGALHDAEEFAREPDASPGDAAAGCCSKCSRTRAPTGWAAAELPRLSSSPEGVAGELHLCPGRAPPCPPQANMALSSTLSKRYSFSGCALT